MRNFLFSAALLILTCQFAVAQNDTRIGGKLMYGSEIENIGIGVTAEFPVLEKLVIAPDLGFYFPKKEGGYKLNAFEINGNVNYYFVQEENIGFYGIAGLNYAHLKAKYDGPSGFGGDGDGNGELGFNLGAGANFNVGKNFLPFAEIKYVLGDFDQLVIAAGVKFNLN
ncbi:outer membrane beta-barrel protein [Sinomicrobium sp.]